jgi:3-phenylpropionate/trans-cinnamate dioxygenase ferredoxin component
VIRVMSVNEAVDLPDQEGRYWLRACASGEVHDDEGLRLNTVPPVSVFTSDGEFFCIDDTCSHEEYSLAEGWVENCVVECALHFARFSLRTGAVLGPPATRPLRVHPLARVGGDLFVALPNSYLAREE